MNIRDMQEVEDIINEIKAMNSGIGQIRSNENRCIYLCGAGSETIPIRNKKIIDEVQKVIEPLLTERILELKEELSKY